MDPQTTPPLDESGAETATAPGTPPSRAPASATPMMALPNTAPSSEAPTDTVRVPEGAVAAWVEAERLAGSANQAIASEVGAPPLEQAHRWEGPRATASVRHYQERLRAMPDIATLHAYTSALGATPDQPPRRQPDSTARQARRVPRWLVRLALVVGLVLIAVRAGLASVAFMAPGGEIVGWTRPPTTVCTLCQVASPAPGAQPLTPTQYAAVLAQHLTLDQKLGQLLMVQFTGQEATPDAIRMINEQGAGGVLLFALNIASADQIRTMTASLQKDAPVPLFMSIDQEGGPVNRFSRIVGPLPAAASLTSTQQARARGEQDAVYLHEYGINLNLAPVADVGTANPQLAARTFGSDPARVAAMAGAYLDGLQASNTVTSCVKHFPGIGATTTDPHLGMPILTRSRAAWESTDVEPYRELFASHDVRAIMVTHEMIPAVDSQLPTSLSPAIIDGTLRGELGFQGVVVTDSLYMGALNAHWSVPQAAVLAVKAGADELIGPDSPQLVAQTKEALRQAVADGTLSKARIDLSVQRILALKITMGLIPLPQPTGAVSSATPGPSPVHTPTRPPAGTPTHTPTPTR